MIPLTNARYINHSCDPNCEIDVDLNVRTIRSVKQGEELTINYHAADMEGFVKNPGDIYFWDECWTFDCLCGIPTCMKLIRGFRSKEKES